MDLRRTATYLGRARVLVGLTLLTAPGPASKAWAGNGGIPARFLARTTGARDVVLGVGTAIAAGQRSGGGDWLSMAALADLADAALSLVTPGLPKRTRVFGLLAAACGVAELQVARRLAELESAPVA